MTAGSASSKKRDEPATVPDSAMATKKGLKSVYNRTASRYLNSQSLSDCGRTSDSVQSEQEKRTNLENALRGLIKLIKAVRFYPPAHPALLAAAREANLGFTPLLQDAPPLSLQVRRDGFLLDDSAIGPGSPPLQNLAAFFFSRRIQRLTILPDLSERDLKAFAASLSLEQGRMLKMGGLPEVLKKALVTTLWVNEVDLTKIEASKSERESEKLEMISQGLDVSEDSLLAQEAAEGEGQIPHELSGASEEDELKKVLDELRRPLSDQRYLQLLQQLVPLFPPYLTESGRHLVLQGLILLCRNASPQQKSEFRREHSRHTLKQVQTDQLLDCMLAFLCSREVGKDTREQISRVLAVLGGNAARRMMLRLAEEGEAAFRKILAEALVRQGANAVPVLIEYLRDDRWYVVRNALAILGEIRSQQAVPHFQPLLGHLDTRVRREAIRALTRIGGKEAVDILLQIVTHGDPELRPYAMLSLGAMKNRAAVPTLLRIVEQRDPWVKMADIKKEAIRALGEIGATEALPLLLVLLKQRKLWRRALHNDLRASAAIALGDIGSAAAAEALNEATEDRSPAVARAAAQALKQLRKG